MYDFSFNSQSLSRELSASDFTIIPDLRNPQTRTQVLSAAEHHAEAGFDSLYLQRSRVKGRDLYQFATLSKELTLRKLSRNIKMLTKVRQSNRDEIVRSLIALLGEGEDFEILKIDIKNFYPSIDRNYIDGRLRSDERLPPSSYSVWQSFSRSLAAQAIPGLPPGLSLSATLSEYCMRDFDRRVANLPGVYYYARYVDDMIIMSTGQHGPNQLLNNVADKLPSGLALNLKKTRTIQIKRKADASPAPIDGSFEFLGYSFSISQKYRDENRFVRKVSVDIAEKKVSKLKSRLIYTVLDFINTRNFQDFEDRIKLITGNYHIYDYDRSFRRKVGIFYNYRQINFDPSPGLHELDSFWSKIVLSRNGNVCRRLHPLLTPKQRRRLLKYTFRTSYKLRTHYHFSADRLGELIECWKYEKN